MPRFSVIIPTYNRASFVVDAIRSVLGGTFSDIEIIVVDDGSTDATAEAVNAVADHRVGYVYQANAGPAIARNTGAAQAFGEYLAFLDSDDLLLPNALASGAAFLDGRPDIGLVFGPSELVDELGNVIGGSRPNSGDRLDLSEMLLAEFPTTSQWMLRADWFRRVGGFDPEYSRYHCGEDPDLVVRLGVAGCRMGWLTTTTCRRRFHGDNASRVADKMRAGHLLFLDKTWSNPALPERLRKLREKTYGRAYAAAAGRAYRSGSLDAARSDVTEALQWDPSLLDGPTPRLLAELEAIACELRWPESLACMGRAFDNLPPAAGVLRTHRQRSLARVAMQTVFTAHARDELEVARTALLNALALDPAWLRNRGVVSILADCLVGRRTAGRARQAVAQARPSLP
jgi:glycosyltransferase involved in cell wall biosynthesis